jgi:CHAP domain
VTIGLLLILLPHLHSAHANQIRQHVQPAVTTQPPFSAFGTLIAPIDNILVYSNGGNVNNMQNGMYGYQYQCVELIQRYSALKWHYPNIWGGVTYAYQMMENHPNADKNGNPQPINAIWNPANANAAGSWPGPQRGDALVFAPTSDGSNGAGHVALVTDVSGGNVYFVEQNFSRYGAHFLPITSNNYIAPRGVNAVRG